VAIKTKDSFSARTRADALILPFFEGKKPSFKSGSLTSLCGSPLKSGDFSGKKGELLVHYVTTAKEKRVVLVGLGREKELTGEDLRRIYARALGSVKAKAKSINVQLPEMKRDFTKPIVEGVLLASYTFDGNKTKKEKAPTEISFLSATPSEVKEVEKLCQSVALTRDLVFQNADVITPSFLAQVAKDLSKKYTNVKTTVLGRKQIQKEGLGLLEAVSRGAHEEPALIIMEYLGDPKSKELTALVGKGITYDTGGLSLKPTSNMITMRDDMGGAGAVLGTMHALCALKIPVNVVAVISSTENAIGPSSYKIGDVYMSYCGKTVEVTNTDAEGRLVLADAISYVQKNFQPKQIIDVATLTGGAIVALGEEASAFMSNDEPLSKELIRAGEETFERLWRLPLYEEYNRLLESKVADFKNSGERKASAIQAGIFLQKFVLKKTKWAHIDIAGMAFPDSLKPYHPIQATGYGVRLLIRYFQNLVR